MFCTLLQCVGGLSEIQNQTDLLWTQVEQAPRYKLKQKQANKQAKRENWTHYHFLLDPDRLEISRVRQLFCSYPCVTGSSRNYGASMLIINRVLYEIFFSKSFYPTRSYWLSCSCNRMTNNWVTCCEKFRKWEMLSHFPNRAETTLIPLGKMEQTIKLGMLLILKLTR